MTERGFGKIIEAAKGLKKLADWLDQEDPHKLLKNAQAAPDAAPCARAQVDGWRCVRKGPHSECVIERTK